MSVVDDIELNRARDVLTSVTDDVYPPINPAVLLNAARSLYLAGADHVGIRRIVAWCAYVMTCHDENVSNEEKLAAMKLVDAVAGALRQGGSR